MIQVKLSNIQDSSEKEKPGSGPREPHVMSFWTKPLTRYQTECSWCSQSGETRKVPHCGGPAVTDEDGCSCVSLCWQYERVGCRCWWSVHTNRRSGFITGCKMMLRHWNVQVLWNNTIQYRKTWTWMLIWSNTASVFTADMLKHSACCHHLFSTTLWIWFVSCLSVSGTEYLYCHTL